MRLVYCRWTLLHYAVMSHSMEMMNAMIEFGAEFGHMWRWDIIGPLDLTPLHMLALGGEDMWALNVVLFTDSGIFLVRTHCTLMHCWRA